MNSEEERVSSLIDILWYHSVYSCSEPANHSALRAVLGIQDCEDVVSVVVGLRIRKEDQ